MTVAYSPGVYFIYKKLQRSMNKLTISIVFWLAIAGNAVAQITPNQKHTFNALIGGKTSAEVWLVEKDSVVIGEIRYQKGKQPIQLRGLHSKDDTYQLFEFETSGNITGILNGKFEGKAFKGEWFSPITRKSKSLNLKLYQTSVAKQVILSAQNSFGGTYTYSYGKDGTAGILRSEACWKRFSYNRVQ
jgi:translation initiation factor IF-1